MFEYLFPIFAFGIVVSAIVCKGLLVAADVARAERTARARSKSSTAALETGPSFGATVAMPVRTNHA